jgi:RNA polymerase sigma factor (sigma-70 family)
MGLRDDDASRERPEIAARSGEEPEMTKTDGTEDLVAQVLMGDRNAKRELWQRVEPWIHDAVVSTLERRLRRAVRSDVEDLVHDVAVKLFEEEGKVLRQWDRGRPLKPYLAVISRNLVDSTLRTKKRNPNTNQPLPDTFEEIPSEGPSPETEAADREYRGKALQGLVSRLPKTGKAVLRWALERRSTDDICGETGMSPAAVHTQRSRIAAAARLVRRRLDGEPDED